MRDGRTNRPARAGLRAAAVSVGLAATLSLAACGPSRVNYAEPSTAVNTQTPAPAETPVPEACSLLTTSQIKALANVVLGEGAPNVELSNTDRSVCDWKTAGSPSPFVRVLVAVGADNIASERALAEASMGASDDVMVIGGGGAYTVANGSILGMRVGDFFVQVTYFTGDTADVRVATTALAQDVAKAL
jgi:hypothetical protein